MNNCIDPYTQLDRWIEWLRKQTKKTLSMNSDQTRCIIDGCREVMKCTENLDLIVVPKPCVIIESCYSDLKRRAVKKIFRRLEDPRIIHSRCYRAVIRRLEEDLQTHDITVWNLPITQAGRPKEIKPGIGMEPVRPEDFYLVYNLRGRTEQALKTISERQPGKFMVIPCFIGNTIRELDPTEAQIKMVPSQFGLPSYVIGCRLLAQIDSLITGLISSPIGALGDMYYPTNGNPRQEVTIDGLRRYHFLQIYIGKVNVKYECLRSDLGMVPFIPAIGIIPPKVNI